MDSNSLGPERDDVDASNSPSPIPTESSSHKSESRIEVFNRDTPLVLEDGSKTYPAPSRYDQLTCFYDPELMGKAL